MKGKECVKAERTKTDSAIKVRCVKVRTRTERDHPGTASCTGPCRRTKRRKAKVISIASIRSWRLSSLSRDYRSTHHGARQPRTAYDSCQIDRPTHRRTDLPMRIILECGSAPTWDSGDNVCRLVQNHEKSRFGVHQHSWPAPIICALIIMSID
jgi:hypothetical protein